MDSFCEQVVKRSEGAKPKIISALLIAIFAVLEIFFIYVYFSMPDPFWLLFTLIIAVVAVVVLSIALPRINNVEFDYSVTGNKFYIDKVVNKRSRKKHLRIDIASIEDMGVIEGDNVPNGRFVRTRDCSTGKLEGSYYCVYRDGSSKYLLIFSPNEKVLQGMRPSLNHDLMMKLFYKK